MKSLKEYILEYKHKSSSYHKTNFTTKEKNDLAKKYEPLAYKIANSYKGYDTEELFATGLYGLSLAMEYYDKEKLTNNFSELSFFAKYIDGAIKDYIKSDTRLVRVPRTQQKGKDMYKTQKITSLDKLIYKDNYHEDDENETKLNPDFDYKDKLKYIDSKYTEENIKFVNDTWKRIFNDIEKNLGPIAVDILKSFYGIDCEPISGKELAYKYGYKHASSISEELNKIKRYLLKKFKNELQDLKELYSESLIEQTINNIIKED